MYRRPLSSILIQITPIICILINSWISIYLNGFKVGNVDYFTRLGRLDLYRFLGRWIDGHYRPLGPPKTVFSLLFDFDWLKNVIKIFVNSPKRMMKSAGLAIFSGLCLVGFYSWHVSTVDCKSINNNNINGTFLQEMTRSSSWEKDSTLCQ